MILRGFCGPWSRAQSPIADDQECVNWYPEKSESGGASTDYSLYPCPGFATVASSVYTPGRGMFGQAGRVFTAVGPRLLEITSGFAIVDRGAILQDQYPVTMVTNGDGGGQLFITSGNARYILDLTTNVLTLVAGASAMGAMLDNFFMDLDVATSTLSISTLLDGLIWDPTQITQRSTASDPWRSLLVAGKYIWLFGERTSDIYYNNQGSPFPFVPFPGATLAQGIAARFSAAEVDGSVIWLGQNADGARTVQQADGITPRPISTKALENALDEYTTVADAEALVYRKRGHTHYALSFPTAKATWVWDNTEKMWHRRSYRVLGTVEDLAWRPRGHVYEFNLHLVGDRESGLIYAMNESYGVDVGDAPMRRVRRFITQRELDLISYPSFELFMEVGLGLNSGQGSNPMMLLSTSNDGGKTWGSPRQRSGGRMGRYDQRVRWMNCGASRHRGWEVVYNDAAPARIMGAFLGNGRG